MRLFQFWDRSPPPDVLGFMETIRIEQTAFDYVRLDYMAADAFIEKEYGGAPWRAWKALRVPAMQADLLRLLLLYSFGGIYVDAAYELAHDPADLPALAAGCGGGVLPLFLMLTNTSFIIANRAADPFLKACIDLAVDNVIHRRSESALMATGPGVVNAVRSILTPELAIIDMQVHWNEEWLGWGWEACRARAQQIIEVTPALIAAHAAFTTIPVIELERWARALPSSHRRRGQHWHTWEGDAYWPDQERPITG